MTECDWLSSAEYPFDWLKTRILASYWLKAFVPKQCFLIWHFVFLKNSWIERISQKNSLLWLSKHKPHCYEATQYFTQNRISFRIWLPWKFSSGVLSWPMRFIACALPQKRRVLKKEQFFFANAPNNGPLNEFHAVVENVTSERKIILIKAK